MMRRVVLNTVVMIFAGLLMAAKLSAQDRSNFLPGYMGKTLKSKKKNIEVDKGPKHEDDGVRELDTMQMSKASQVYTWAYYNQKPHPFNGSVH